MVVSALSIASSVNPYESDLPVGTVIPAVSAVDWLIGQRNCDIRPRLLDNGISRLLDSGSQISVTRKGPDDKIDPTFKLVAVNGSKIPTYGVKEIEIKMGRKTYKIPAIICDIQQDILGMDFITKYKLNFEWDEFDQSELYLVDRRAQIKELSQVVTVPTSTLRVSYLDGVDSKSVPALEDVRLEAPQSQADNEAIAFEVACMKQLDESVDKKKSIEEQLKLHSTEYVKLIRRYPKLLEPSFNKGEPTHGVYHRIDTQGPPCKTKRRPIVMDSAKAAAGKVAWEQMEKDGALRGSKPGPTPTTAPPSTWHQSQGEGPVLVRTSGRSMPRLLSMLTLSHC